MIFDRGLFFIGLMFLAILVMVWRPFAREPKAPGELFSQKTWRVIQIVVFIGVGYSLMKISPKGSYLPAFLGGIMAVVATDLLNRAHRYIVRLRQHRQGARARRKASDGGIDGPTRRREIGR